MPRRVKANLLDLRNLSVSDVDVVVVGPESPDATLDPLLTSHSKTNSGTSRGTCARNIGHALMLKHLHGVSGKRELGDIHPRTTIISRIGG
jgi:hypothetical protein